jgi:hypothetical protein
MLGTRSCLTAFLALAFATAPASATTVDEVIAKHIEARGGRQAWEKIDSFKVTGRYTAFSKVAPFEMVKQRGDRYWIDHMLGDRKAIIAYDGETMWWDNRWFQEGAQTVEGLDRTVLMRDVDFVTPFFEIDEKGYRVELTDETEYEGMPAIGVKLTRGEDDEETWYLDPETYLEVARTSPGSDFGTPMEQRTYFDDFREVDGVKFPFFVESQFYTRTRTMQVDNVETNVAVDAALFEMPPPMGMGPLQSLIGSWNVAVQSRQQPGAPWQESERTSAITGKMRGALLEETYESDQGDEVIRTYSFDRFKKRYRMTQIDDRQTQLDVREGDIGEDGALVVSNLDTGTSFETFGQTVHGRLSVKEIADDSFTVEQEFSIDGGESWFVAVKSVYTRSGK